MTLRQGRIFAVCWVAFMTGLVTVLLMTTPMTSDRRAALIAAVVFFTVIPASIAALAHPERFIDPPAREASRMMHLRTGNLTAYDIEWLIRRYVITPIPPPLDDLYTLMCLRLFGNTDRDPRLGRAYVDWLRGDHDPVLLRNALSANLTVDELTGHLTGSTPLDVEAVTMLGAFDPWRTHRT